MATMINCGMDWSFDLFAQAMDSVKALPLAHGVRPSANLTDEQVFAVYVKTAIKFADFEHYSVDDAIRYALEDMNFSDWYKDTFNQRPHFETFLIGALCGVYGSTWNVALWTWRNPVEEFKRMARECRDAIERQAKEQGF